jgi:hypothetical protein
MPFHVVDISHGDHVTSFAAAVAAGIWGVINKATTGATGRITRTMTGAKPRSTPACSGVRTTAGAPLHASA